MNNFASHQCQPTPPKRHALAWVGGYLLSVRVNRGDDGQALMAYSTTTDRKEALTFCTKAAALTVLAAMEHHKKTEFDVIEMWA